MPEEYNFFPRSYSLPHDYKDFLEEIAKKKAKKNPVPSTYIVKPNDESQGRGIYITRNEEDITADDVCVV